MSKRFHAYFDKRITRAWPLVKPKEVTDETVEIFRNSAKLGSKDQKGVDTIYAAVMGEFYNYKICDALKMELDEPGAADKSSDDIKALLEKVLTIK